MVRGGGRTLLHETFGQPVPVGAKSPIFNRYSLVPPQPSHHNEKSSINTNVTRFPVSLRWSSYVAPETLKGAQKRKTANFRVKSHFAWTKSARKFMWKLSATKL